MLGGGGHDGGMEGDRGSDGGDEGGNAGGAGGATAENTPMQSACKGEKITRPFGATAACLNSDSSFLGPSRVCSFTNKLESCS